MTMKHKMTAAEYKAWLAAQAKPRKAASTRSHIKAGWRTIAGVRTYYRSRNEANFARYLEWLRTQGEVEAWQYEPRTFEFHQVRHGVTRYTPDFLVTYPGGRAVWVEVKGHMDKRSRTTIARFRKYYPKEEHEIKTTRQIKIIEQQVGKIVPGWEFPDLHKQA